MSKNTVFNKLPLGEVAAIQKAAKNVVVQTPNSGAAAVNNTRGSSNKTNSGSEQASTATLSLPSMSNARRANAVNSASERQQGLKNDSILPSVSEGFDSLMSFGADLFDEAVGDKEVDANRLMHKNCAIKPSDLKGTNKTGKSQKDAENCNCGCEDCEPTSLVSCCGEGKTKSKGGGFVESGVLAAIGNAAKKQILGTADALAGGLIDSPTAIRDLVCNMDVSISLQDGKLVAGLSNTPEINAAINKVAKVAGKEGNVKYLKSIESRVDSNVMSAITKTNSKSLFNTALSGGDPSAVNDLRILNSDWLDNVTPSNVNDVTSYSNLSDLEQLVVKAAETVKDSGTVRA